MINELKTCDHCGARLTGRWERLSPGLCKTLVKFYGLSAEKNNVVHLQNDCGFTKNEYNNFQKLRYFGLVAKVEESPGNWLLTRRGKDFVQNKLSISKKVYVFRNRIVERDIVLTSISEALKTEPYWLKKDSYENSTRSL